jgi:predicted transcriptional regulator
MSSFIPKQPKKDRDQITIKLDRDVLENLERYCRYLDSSRDYVINQCLVFIFRKDRQFHQWAAANAEAPAGSVAKMATK